MKKFNEKKQEAEPRINVASTGGASVNYLVQAQRHMQAL